MEDFNSGKEMSYTQLLLFHLNRISNLSSHIQGELIEETGLKMYYKETDKEVAFGWTAAVLECLIPEDLHDEAFKKDVKALREKYSEDRTKFGYNKGLLAACINLLHRKGLLGAQNKQIGNFKKPKVDIPIREEWEE